ncbi:hypothetical protein B7R21_15940 [Subtercola boreus]|uniref:Uncharacterized protein n=2 Tax=Subtercola boreus TaxID=120213 RepID=A0A3E0VE65_9MICO|nr:hypothetical protein B7R21_15940 [Subtercola boreus]
MAIDRTRIFGITSILVGVLFIAVAVIELIFRFDVFRLFQLGAGVTFIVIGWTNRTKSIEQLRTLELEHGVGAGIQKRR